MAEPCPETASPANKRARRGERCKRKLGDSITYEDLVRDWTQCCFLIPHKQRLCNMSRTPNSRYCGNHIHLTDEKPSKLDGEGAGEVDDERIACPLDPSHSIFRRNLDVHVKKCNAKKYQDELASLPYYCANCNGGVARADTVESSEPVDLAQLVQTIRSAFESVELCPLADVAPTAAVCAADERIRSTVGGTQTSFKQTRHVDQDIAIVHQLARRNLVVLDDPAVAESETESTPRHIYLEFGAGKGLLGLSVHLADPKAFLVFIERSSNRKKVDKVLNDRGFTQFERVRMDIRHCLVPELTCITRTAENSTPVTIVAKHLCGLASDLAIRSLSHLGNSQSLKKPSRGLGIATCCHHACNFDDYVGQDWLRKHGIRRSEFNVLKQWSAWATLDRVADYRQPKTTNTVQAEEISQQEGDDNEEEHMAPQVAESMRPANLSADQMLDIGKMCKRFLDYGRVLYMRESLGMAAELVYYCDSKLTPECVMILASDDKASFQKE